jgi:hypothetical protein
MAAGVEIQAPWQINIWSRPAGWPGHANASTKTQQDQEGSMLHTAREATRSVFPTGISINSAGLLCGGIATPVFHPGKVVAGA